jgi:hypothetical protein
MRSIAIAAVLALSAPSAIAELCPRWSPAQFAGELDTALINEASGLAASRAFAGALYHHNDSGDSGRFFVTDLSGAHARVVAVRDFSPADAEDMAVGPCPGADASCVYLGDIGDNFRRRTEIGFVAVRERQRFGRSETALARIVARYPDRAHDAEGFALHPNGDLYLITKPIDFNERRAGPALVFRLTAAQLAAGGRQTFEQVGEIDLPYLLWEQPVRGHLATGLDIAPDGTRAALVTYTSIVEFALNPAEPWKPSRSWRIDHDYRVIAMPRLPQAEAIAYAADGEALIVDTEFSQNFGQAPLYRFNCVRAPG